MSVEGGGSLPGEAFDILEHGGLVLFDREDIVGFFCFRDKAGRFGLGMQGIGNTELKSSPPVSFLQSKKIQDFLRRLDFYYSHIMRIIDCDCEERWL